MLRIVDYMNKGPGFSVFPSVCTFVFASILITELGTNVETGFSSVATVISRNSLYIRTVRRRYRRWPTAYGFRYLA